MPLEELTAIDLILAPNSEGKIALVITDAGVTADPQERLNLLVEKLSRYMGAILSGELNEDGIERPPNDYCIRVVCANRPTEEMFHITQISPEGDASLCVAVEFEEYPEGAWGEAPVADGETHSEVDELTQLAFQGGEEWLGEGTPPLFILFARDGQRTLSPMEGVTSHEDLMEKLAAWGHEHRQNVSVCVLLGMSHVEHEGESIQALVAQIFERGAESSWSLGRRLVEYEGCLKPVGDAFAIGHGENILA